MRQRFNQRGSAHLALALTVLVLAVVVFAGYKVYQNRQDKTQANKTSTSVIQTSSGAIQSSADLNSATNQLNNQPVDSDLNPDDLNSDTSALL
jgi:predicted negative regulator of RcsB-dependent stress response